MIDLEWYRTFKLVYQLGTFAQAAEELFMSPPGVRKQIGALEAYVGQKLFERQSKKVVPTAYAHLLYGQVIGPVEQLERAEATYRKRASQVKPTVQIGSPHEFFSQVFARRIHELDFNVRVALGAASVLLSEVEQGTLDMAISVIHPRRYDVDIKPFFTEKLLLVGNSRVRQTELEQLVRDERWKEAEAWLDQRTWYAYSGNLTIIRRFWRNNFGKRPTMRPAYIIPDLNLIKRCLMYSHQEAVSLLPDYLCGSQFKSGELQIVWTGKNVSTNDIFWAINKKSPYRQEVEVVLSLLQGLRRW